MKVIFLDGFAMRGKLHLVND